MKERIFDILVWLMSEMQRKAVGDIDLTDLRDRGYTQSEINAAFSWIEEHIIPFGTSGATRSAHPHAGSRRVFHAAEKLLLSTEGQGYLIQLSELGLLDDKDFEAVIDRVMASGYDTVTVEELRGIVATVLTAKTGGLGGTPPSTVDGEETVH